MKASGRMVSSAGRVFNTREPGRSTRGGSRMICTTVQESYVVQIGSRLKGNGDAGN